MIWKRPTTYIVVDETKGYGGVRRAYTDIPEGQMHYRYQGSGKQTLLLLHMAQSSSDEFTRMIPLLSKRYRVLAPDHLGFGESALPPRQYEISDYAQSIVSFMDAMKVEKAHILGVHAAAQVAVEIELTHPERVESLLLSGLPCWADPKESLAHGEWPEVQRIEVKWDGSHLMDYWERACRFGESVQSCNERALDYFKSGPRGEEMHAAAYKYHTPAKVPLIKCPTLLYCGSKERLRPGTQLASTMIPGCKFVVIPGASVIMNREMPKDVAAVILDFLKGLEADKRKQKKSTGSRR